MEYTDNSNNNKLIVFTYTYTVLRTVNTISSADLHEVCGPGTLGPLHRWEHCGSEGSQREAAG